MGTLVISRPRQFADLIRRYRIILDGREIGLIRAGGEIQLEVPDGAHQLVACIDWTRSNDLSVDIRAGEATEIEVGSNVRGWRLLGALYFATFGYTRYLYLRQRTVDGRPDASGGKSEIGR